MNATMNNSKGSPTMKRTEKRKSTTKRVRLAPGMNKQASSTSTKKTKARVKASPTNDISTYHVAHTPGLQLTVAGISKRDEYCVAVDVEMPKSAQYFDFCRKIEQLKDCLQKWETPLYATWTASDDNKGRVWVSAWQAKGERDPIALSKLVRVRELVERYASEDGTALEDLLGPPDWDAFELTVSVENVPGLELRMCLGKAGRCRNQAVMVQVRMPEGTRYRVSRDEVEGFCEYLQENEEHFVDSDIEDENMGLVWVEYDSREEQEFQAIVARVRECVLNYPSPLDKAKQDVSPSS